MGHFQACTTVGLAMMKVIKMSALALAAQMAVVAVALVACSSPPTRQEIGIAQEVTRAVE